MTHKFGRASGSEYTNCIDTNKMPDTAAEQLKKITEADKGWKDTLKRNYDLLRRVQVANDSPAPKAALDDLCKQPNALRQLTPSVNTQKLPAAMGGKCSAEYQAVLDDHHTCPVEDGFTFIDNATDCNAARTKLASKSRFSTDLAQVAFVEVTEAEGLNMPFGCVYYQDKCKIDKSGKTRYSKTQISKKNCADAACALWARHCLRLFLAHQ